jgi:hypothetical protein
VIETSSILSAGSIVSSTASPDNNTNTNSNSSHTGAIVGGVVGGVVGLVAILSVLFFVLRRQQRRRELEEAFDGNFDPDRIVRAGPGAGLRDSMADTAESDGYGYAYAGGQKAKVAKAAKRSSRTMDDLSGTLPNIPVDGAPEMQQLMSPGGRAGGGGSSSSTSRRNLLDDEDVDTPYRSVNGSPSPSPGPYHSSTFPPVNSASSDGHGGMGRPPSMVMSQSNSHSASASISMSGHGHSIPPVRPPSMNMNMSAAGYSRPSSFHDNPYGGMGSTSPPSSPPPQQFYPASAYAGYATMNSNSNPTRRYSAGPGPGLAVMNPSLNPDRSEVASASHTSTSGAANDVLVHQDGGRALEEIPPSYDSLGLGSRERPAEKHRP